VYCRQTRSAAVKHRSPVPPRKMFSRRQSLRTGKIRGHVYMQDVFRGMCSLARSIGAVTAVHSRTAGGNKLNALTLASGGQMLRTLSAPPMPCPPALYDTAARASPTWP
jgi:hypothetical protein